MYDESGSAYSFIYNGAQYYYVRNLQGDNVVGQYNPIRYRGYYYDEVSGLYYLNTRYYDADVGRFISPDSVDYLSADKINGLNLYAYCANNPVMNKDPNGTSWWSDFWNSVGEWFVSVGEWFAETFWQNLIVDKVFNSFIIDTLWEKGLKPFGLATWDVWGKISDSEIVDRTVSIGSIVVSVLGVLVTSPIVATAGLIIGVIGFLLDFRKWFNDKEDKSEKIIFY